MNWKRIVSDLLLYTVIEFAIFVLLFWKLGPHFNPHVLIMCALGAIALSFGIVGSVELNRGGHRKIHRTHGLCLGVFFIISGIIFIIMLHTKTVLEGTIEIFIGANISIFAAKLPLAVYLSRKQKKSSAKSTVADAN